MKHPFWYQENCIQISDSSDEDNGDYSDLDDVDGVYVSSLSEPVAS